MDANYIGFETLLANRAAAEWAFWSMVGTVIAAFATVAAVISSLIIAFASMRPKPRIRGEVTLSAMKGVFWQKGISINIANIGVMPINITSIVWHFDGSTTFMHDFSPHGHNLPKKLEHGESALFFIENDENITWAKDVKNFILQNHGKIEKLRISVNLGTMDKFFIKPSDEVITIIKSA
ncbi:TPA: hypothetical protein ACJIWL_000608 [Enterobacter kobei]